MGDKLPIVIQGKGRKWARCALGLFPGGDMHRAKRYAGFLSGCFQQRNILGGKGALARIIQCEAGGQLLHRLADTWLETRLVRIWGKGKIQKLKIRIGSISNRKALVSHIFGVGQKAHLLSGGQHDQSLFAFFLAVPNALVQKLVGIAVSFELPRNPETVDKRIALRFNRCPGVLRRDIFNKAFSPDVPLEEYQPFVQTIRQPRLF